MTQQVDPVHLRQVLSQYYDVGELRTMCFDLDIEYENLGGQGRAGKVVELIAFAQRNNRLDDIVGYVGQTRPFIQLKMRDTPPPPPDQPTSQGSGVTHVTHVHGDVVEGDKVGGDKVGGDSINVGDISGSGVAIGRGASATVETGPTYNITGDVTGSVIGGGEVHTENIAGGDIHIGTEPKTGTSLSNRCKP